MALELTSNASIDCKELRTCENDALTGALLAWGVGRGTSLRVDSPVSKRAQAPSNSLPIGAARRGCDHSRCGSLCVRWTVLRCVLQTSRRQADLSPGPRRRHGAP